MVSCTTVRTKTQASGVGVGAAPSTEPAPLLPALAVAVPMWIETLRLESWEHVRARAVACLDIIAEHGDNILYRSVKKGDTAKAFSALAEGIAAASFVPGGITVFGQHWESRFGSRIASVPE